MHWCMWLKPSLFSSRLTVPPRCCRLLSLLLSIPSPFRSFMQFQADDRQHLPSPSPRFDCRSREHLLPHHLTQKPWAWRSWCQGGRMALLGRPGTPGPKVEHVDWGQRERAGTLPNRTRPCCYWKGNAHFCKMKRVCLTSSKICLLRAIQLPGMRTREESCVGFPGTANRANWVQGFRVPLRGCERLVGLVPGALHALSPFRPSCAQDSGLSAPSPYLRPESSLRPRWPSSAETRWEFLRRNYYSKR